MQAILFLMLAGMLALVQAAPAYTVKTLADLAVYPESRALAEVVPENQSRIAAEVTGRIEAIPVKVGQVVEKGTILLRMDARQYRLALKQAENQAELLSNRYELSRLQLQQAQSLHQSNFISAQALAQRQTELAVIESELKIARNSAAQAKLALSKTILRAPFTGAVKERLAAEGELAAPGQPVLTLVEFARNELRAEIANRDIFGLKNASSLSFRQGNDVYPVQIARVSPIVDARSQTREVIFHAKRKLVSGASGELLWASRVPHLPPAYLQQRNGQQGVWIEQNGQPAFRVLPDAQTGRPVPLDMPTTTRIIDEGRFALSTGPAGQ